MTSEFDADSEELLFELGQLHAARSRELAEAGAAQADFDLGPLSEAESRALIATTLSRTQANAPAASPLSASRLRRRTLLAFSLAAAAGVALLAAPRRLPEYELASPPPDAMVRSASHEHAPAGPPQYEIGRELKFVLRPERVVDGSVHVSLFSLRDGIHALRPAQIVRVPGGGMVVTLVTGGAGYVPALGADTLVFAITPSGEARSEDVERGISSARLRLLRLPLIWGAP